jgi:hypothetical protein
MKLFVPSENFALIFSFSDIVSLIFIDMTGNKELQAFFMLQKGVPVTGDPDSTLWVVR